MARTRLALFVAVLLGGSAAAQMLAGFDGQLTGWRLTWLVIAIATAALGAWKSFERRARTICQSAVPDALQGRFHSASRLVGWGFTPVAAGLAGIVAQAVSLRAAFGVFAIACAGLIYPFLKVVTSSALKADNPARELVRS